MCGLGWGPHLGWGRRLEEAPALRESVTEERGQGNLATLVLLGPAHGSVVTQPGGNCMRAHGGGRWSEQGLAPGKRPGVAHANGLAQYWQDPDRWGV